MIPILVQPLYMNDTGAEYTPEVQEQPVLLNLSAYSKAEEVVYKKADEAEPSMAFVASPAQKTMPTTRVVIGEDEFIFKGNLALFLEALKQSYKQAQNAPGEAQDWRSFTLSKDDLAAVKAEARKTQQTSRVTYQLPHQDFTAR